MPETEEIILSVEQYPCIWDVNHTDYYNRDIKELAWQQICKEIYKNWETCTDKSHKSAELKKKWTNIRDYYRKELQKSKNDPTGSAAKKSKKYVYSDLLHFLKPVFAKGNYPKEKQDSESNKIPNEEDSIELETVNYMEWPEPTSPVGDKKSKVDVPNQILNLLQQKQKQTAAITEEDDDTKYLLSFRSYMKTMNDSQKLDFKMGMLKLVKVIMINKQSPT